MTMNENTGFDYRHRFPVDILFPENWRDPVRYRTQVDVVVQGIKIPRGFITDGATVPRWLWALFPPIDRYFTAALVHDYLLVNGATWKTANAKFGAQLRKCNISRWRRWLMVAGVRLYGLTQEG